MYQWQQEMFDGTKQTFEMIKRIDTVEVIATYKDKIFITHQSQPTKSDFYSLLGGRLERGEDPLTAVKRELMEEGGLESDDWTLWKTYQPVSKMEWFIYTYIARNCRRVADQKLDAGERIELQECTFDQFVDIVLSEKYWGNELSLDLHRMKDQGKLNDLKTLLFHSQE